MERSQGVREQRALPSPLKPLMGMCMFSGRVALPCWLQTACLDGLESAAPMQASNKTQASPGLQEAHLAQPLDALDAEGEELLALQLRAHPVLGRLQVPPAALAPQDRHLPAAPFGQETCRDEQSFGKHQCVRMPLLLPIRPPQTVALRGQRLLLIGGN